MVRSRMHNSIIHVFLDTVDKMGSAAALKTRRGSQWESISWREYARRVRLVARGLMTLGLPDEGTVAIIGENRWEWLVADLGTLAAGGVPAPIYPTCTPEQVAFVAGHSEATIAVAEDETQLEKIRQMRGELPKLETIILMDGGGGRDDEAISFGTLLALGEQTPESALDDRIEALSLDRLATLIYTSGTTGVPKGVMLTHKNLVFTARATVEAYGADHKDRVISYLPLSHIAEQMMSIHFPATIGGTVYFAENIDALPETIRDVRPTLFLGVPRVWEKIQAKMMEAGAQNPWLKKKLAAWARGVGLEAGYRVQRGERPPLAYGLANKLVFSTVRERLGLDQCRIPVTTAAPIAKDTLEFFMSLGITLLEIYGMSECTGPATVSTAAAWKTGSAGRALPHTEVKIAEDGEVCMRGDNVFDGYLKLPDATAEALDEDGWLHSGDVGRIEDGFLYITDRKKELIITAGGKNVAPQAIEALLKAIPGVSLAAVIGDRRKYLSALLTLEPEAAARAAEQCGAEARAPRELAADPAFRDYLQKQIDEMNAGLARYETIKRFTVLPDDFSIETGELTPTMKLKRKVIGEAHEDEIEAMYPDG